MPRFPEFFDGCRYAPASILPRQASLSSDILVPNFRIRVYVLRQKRSALHGVQINDMNAERKQPIQAALEVTAFADPQRAESKLPYQSAAIPARRQRGDHDQVPIAALAARV